MPDAKWHNDREARQLPMVIEAFRQYSTVGETEAERAETIAALPDAEFKGRHLKTVVCYRCGRSRNFWPSQLWVMIALDHVACPWCLLRG